MKASELISILERVVEHFEDCDVELMIPRSGYTDTSMIVKDVTIKVDGAVTITACDRPAVTT